MATFQFVKYTLVSYLVFFNIQWPHFNLLNIDWLAI